MATLIDSPRFIEKAKKVPRIQRLGRVVDIRGSVIRAKIDAVSIGDLACLRKRKTPNTDFEELRAQVLSFTDGLCILGVFGDTKGLGPGSEILSMGAPPTLNVGHHLLGKVLDGLGSPLSSYSLEKTDISCHLHKASKIAFKKSDWVSLDNTPPDLMTRRPVDSILSTGVRAIDAFTTLGRGQRLGIFAEPGVGKTMLMEQIARCADVDINVIALIGERGREVSEFLRYTLTPETMKRAVVVVSTSDEAPQLRVGAAMTATRIAEYFRDKGLSVLLQMDSLTRLFRAYREIGLSSGESPVRQGYPPSCFEKLPKLVERAANSDKGYISALYTVLLSEGVEDDPMVEEVKGLIDGHIILSRDLANQGQYPAIDIVSSLSRLQHRLLPEKDLNSVNRAKKIASRLQRDRDLVLMGGIPDAELSLAFELEPILREFLIQRPDTKSSIEDTLTTLSSLLLSSSSSGKF